MKNLKSNLNNSFQKIKGVIGEHIVKELFETLGYDVHFNGMEYRLPVYAGVLRKNKKNMTIFSTLNYAPDFFILSSDREKVFLVEVKYRKNGKLKVEDILAYSEPETIIIVITTGMFYCAKIKELQSKFRDAENKSAMIGENEFIPLADFGEFAFTDEQKSIVESFIKMSDRFFNNLEGVYEV